MSRPSLLDRLLGSERVPPVISATSPAPPVITDAPAAPAAPAPVKAPARPAAPRGSPPASLSSSGSGSYFDALSASPNRAPIPSFINESLGFLTGQTLTETANRQRLAGMGRYLVDSYAPAWGAVDAMANYSTPVIPRANSPDRNWNKLSNDLFDDWMSRTDFKGQFDFAEIQRLLCIAIDTDGDVGAIMVGDPGNPQVRCFPTWQIGPEFIPAPENSGLQDGVYVNVDGQVLGYQVGLDRQRIVRFSTNEMVLIMESDRLERVRGLSALRRGMNDLRDWKEIKGLETLATKIESSFPSVIKGNGAGITSDWDDPENPPPTDGTVPKSVQLMSLLGGEIPYIEGDLQQLTSERPGTNKVEYLDTLVGLFVTGIGIPAGFYLDAKNTGPGWRAVLGKAQRRFNRRQRTMMKFARWCWLRVMADAISTGLLPAMDGQFRPRFLLPSLVTIDLGDAAQADREAVSRGLMSRQRFHGNAQHEWDDETDQIFLEDEMIISRLKEQATRLGVPLEIMMSRHGYTINPVPVPPAPKTPPPAAP